MIKRNRRFVNFHAAQEIGAIQKRDAKLRLSCFRCEHSISRVLCRAKHGGNHLSRPPVAKRLQRLNPEGSAGRIIPSLFGLAPCGVYQAARLPGRWCALTAPFHPYLSKTGGFRFYGTFPEVTLAGRYPAHCPVEPGLSSCGSYVRQRLPFMLAKVIIQTSLQSVKLQRISKKSRAAASATISTLSPNSSANRFAKISTTGCSVAKCPASTTWIPSAAARCAS